MFAIGAKKQQHWKATITTTPSNRSYNNNNNNNCNNINNDSNNDNEQTNKTKTINSHHVERQFCPRLQTYATTQVNIFMQ